MPQSGFFGIVLLFLIGSPVHAFNGTWTNCNVDCGIGTRGCLLAGTEVHYKFCGFINDTICSTSSCVGPIVRAVTNFNKNGAVGQITFDQYEQGVNSANISINLAGVQIAGGWHVHKFPPSISIIGTGLDNECDETGGHWVPTPQNLAIERFEEGDLASKFGSLMYYKGITVIVVEVPGFPIKTLAWLKLVNVNVELDRVQARIGRPPRNEDLIKNPNGLYEISVGDSALPIRLSLDPVDGQKLIIDGFFSGEFVAKPYYSDRQFPGTNNLVIKKDRPSYLSLTGTNSILGRSIVFHKAANGDRWLCATVVPDGDYVEAIAVFTGYIQGEIVFRQKLSDDPYRYQTSMYVRVNYSDHASTQNHKWHVHVDPVGTDGNVSISARCLSTGGHWNPTGIAGACVDPSNHTKCEVGDLSGKHGLMPLPEQKVLQDMHLPLYGADSILGRSITIHAENSGSPRIACATITNVTGRPIKRRTVTFDSTGIAVGSITFQQTVGDLITNPCTDSPNWRSSEGETCDTYESEQYCKDGSYGEGWDDAWGLFSAYADTNGVDASQACCSCGKDMIDTTSTPVIVTVDLNYMGMSKSSVDHKWHVHVGAVGMAADDDHTSETALDARCKSTGGHFDPTDKLSVGAAQYSTVCGTTRTKQMECEVGDLFNKHGPIAIPTKRTWIDYSLSLYGPNSIVGRSVVVHQENSGGPRITCGSVGNNLLLKAIFSGDVVGMFSFSQDMTDPTAPAIVFIKLILNASYLTTGDYEWYLSSGTQDNCQNSLSNVSRAGCGSEPTKQKRCDPMNMMGKHGLLTLPTNGIWFTDHNINVMDINQTFISVKSTNGTHINCVPLRFVKIEKAVGPNPNSYPSPPPVVIYLNTDVTFIVLITVSLVLLVIILLLNLKFGWVQRGTPLSTSGTIILVSMIILILLVIAFSYAVGVMPGTVVLIIFVVLGIVAIICIVREKGKGDYSMKMTAPPTASSSNAAAPVHMTSSSMDIPPAQEEPANKVERGDDGLWRVTEDAR